MGDRIGAGNPACLGLEHGRIARLVERPAAEQGGGCGPRLPVSRALVGPELGAERDQLGEVGDSVDVLVAGDANEPVGVQVIPQQEGGVAVGRLEQARAPS